MQLVSIHVHGIGALADLRVSFLDAITVAPRKMTVIFGADGVGKTSVLCAIAQTRPGHALPLLRKSTKDAPSFAIAEWMLGADDEARPHPLVVTSPNAVLDEPDGAAAMRRREQAHFDKRAQEEGGFMFAAFSGQRWFSKTPSLLTTPDRTIAKYDVRAAASFDDATRADLAREAKQIIAYATIAAALERAEDPLPFHGFDHAIRTALDVVLSPFDIEYDGVDPGTLEPRFIAIDRDVGFDELPKGARHLVAIVAIGMRALFGAYPRDGKPLLQREGVIAVDDIELQQDPAIQRILPGLLRRALPNVQFIITTASPNVAVGCADGELVALRRLEDRVTVHDGHFATIH